MTKVDRLDSLGNEQHSWQGCMELEEASEDMAEAGIWQHCCRWEHGSDPSSATVVGKSETRFKAEYRYQRQKLNW